MLALVNRTPMPVALAAPERVEIKKVLPAAPVAENKSAAEPPEPQFPEPPPAKAEVKIVTPEPPAEVMPSRREVVMPDENREFPL
jgi:hypothetical protein